MAWRGLALYGVVWCGIGDASGIVEAMGAFERALQRHCSSVLYNAIARTCVLYGVSVAKSLLFHPILLFLIYFIPCCFLGAHVCVHRRPPRT